MQKKLQCYFPDPPLLLYYFSFDWYRIGRVLTASVSFSAPLFKYLLGEPCVANDRRPCGVVRHSIALCVVMPIKFVLISAAHFIRHRDVFDYNDVVQFRTLCECALTICNVIMLAGVSSSTCGLCVSNRVEQYVWTFVLRVIVLSTNIDAR
jgi:hypothetical protein